jgi:RNA polymerase sigma-70 factor, ECF subfamily
MNQSTVEEYVLLYQSEIFRYLRYLGANRQLAEDLVQETFVVSLHSAGPSSEEEFVVKGWLRGVARNLFLSHCRKLKRENVVVSESAASIAETVWAKEFMRGGDGFDFMSALNQCVERLQDLKRSIVQLKYRDGVSRKDIAAKVSMTEDGVKTTLRRIRKELGSCVESRLRTQS